MTASTADWGELWRSGVLPRFCFVSLGIAFHAGAENMISTIMPAIVRDIGGVQLNGWAFAIYEIGSIIAGAMAGRLSTLWPVRFNMTAAALLYAAGSMVTASAPSMEVALGGRLLAGAGGGALIALCFVALQRFFAPAMWPQFMAIFSVVWGVAAFGGPLYGSLMQQMLGWRWAFAVFAAAALVYAICCLIVLRVEPAAQTSTASGRLPLLGLASLAAGITAIAAAGVEPRPAVAGLLVALGLAGLAGCLMLDRRKGIARLFPSDLFKPASTGGIGLQMVAALAISTSSFGFYGPLLLAALHNFSPVITGLLIASESVSWSILSILLARAPKQWERWIIRAGAVMIPLGVLGFAYAIPAGSVAAILFFALLQGGGFGVLWPFTNRMVVEAAAMPEKEITAAAFSTTQRMGYAIGAAVAGIIANANGFAGGFSAAAAATAAVPLFLYFFPLAALGCLCAFRLTRRVPA